MVPFGAFLALNPFLSVGNFRCAVKVDLLAVITVLIKFECVRTSLAERNELVLVKFSS